MRGLESDLTFLLAWFFIFPSAPVLCTTTICPVSCPTQSPFSHVHIDKVSDGHYVLVTSNNCPPYFSHDTTVCFDGRLSYIPKNPVVLDDPYEIGLFNPLRLSIGLLRNGVLLYGAADNLGRDMMLSGLLEFDQCMATVDGNGVYYSRGLYAYYNGQIHDYDAGVCNLPVDHVGSHSPSMGWMWDGYEIYGRWNGHYDNIPLDECGGHDHQLSVNTSGYHYHMSLEYPYTINCFHGCPNRMNNPSIFQQCTYDAPTSVPTTTSRGSGLNLVDGMSIEVLLGILVTSIACFCCVCIYVAYNSGREQRVVQRKPRWVNNTQFWTPPPERTSERQYMLERRPAQQHVSRHLPVEYPYRTDAPKKTPTYPQQHTRQNLPVEYPYRTDPRKIPTYPRYRELTVSRTNRIPPHNPPQPIRHQPNHFSRPQTSQLGPSRRLPSRREQEWAPPHPQRRRERPSRHPREREAAAQDSHNREWTPLPTETYPLEDYSKHNRDWTPLPQHPMGVEEIIQCIGKGECKVVRAGVG